MDHLNTDPLKDPIQVSVRIRPLDLEHSPNSCITLDPSYPSTLYLSHSSDPPKPFTFDNIFSDESSQECLFEIIAKPLMISCLEGYNVCIFAYGQTGAGKTFTIMGNNDSSSTEKGLIPRTINHLFQHLGQLSEEFLIKVSFLEIYNEQIIDLLDNSKKNLLLREDLKKGVYVENLSEEICIDSIEAEELLKKGSRIRHIGSTAMNIESSRSHSVFTILIESKRNNNGLFHIKSSKFSFVDLAGSERQRNLSVISGDRLKEGCNINRSLHVLGNVINALVEVSDGKTRHIHYRDSKLTFLLKDSLGGNSKTSLIANINPAEAYFQETFSTIKFAKRTKMIKNRAFINEEASGNLEGLKQEIKRLKQELAAQHFYKLENKENYQQIDNSFGNKSAFEKLLKKYVDNSIEIETGLQLEISRNQGNLTIFQENFKQLHGIEQDYRSIIEFMQERIKRNNNEKDKESILFKENEQLKNLMKKMPFLMKLHKENLYLKSELKRIEEGSFLGVLQEKGDNNEISRHLAENVSLLKEIKTFIIENQQIIQENTKKEEISDTESISKEAYKAMEKELKEKIELLNLELMENRPNNGIITQKLIESQENLENAYEKIALLEGEIEEINVKSLKTIEIHQETQDLQKKQQDFKEYAVQTEGIIEEIEEIQKENHNLKEKLIVLEEAFDKTSDFIKEIDAVKQQLVEKTLEKKRFFEDNVKLKENILGLEERLLEKELTISQLQQANQSFREQLKETNNLNEKSMILNEEEKNVYKENLNKLQGIIREKEELIMEKNMENFEIEGKFKEFEEIEVKLRNYMEKSDALQNERREKEELINDYKENNKVYEKILEEKNDLIKNLMTNIENYKENMINFEIDINEKTSLVKNLNENIESYKENKETYERNNEDSVNLIRKLKENIESYKKQIEIYERSIENNESLIKNLKEEIENYKENININEKSMENKDSLTKNLNENIENYKQNLNTNEKVIDEKNDVINTLNNDMENYKENIKNLNKNIEKYKETIKIDEKTIKEKNDLIKSLNANDKTIKFYEKAIEEKTLLLEKTLKDNEMLILNLTHETKQYKEKIHENNMKNCDLPEENHTFKDKLIDVNNENQYYKESISAIEGELQQLREIIDNLNRQSSEEKSLMTSYESEIEKYKEMIENHEISLKDKNHIISLKTSEIEHHQEINVNLRNDINERNDIISIKSSEIEKYIKTLENHESSLREKNLIISTKSTEIEQCKEKLKEKDYQIISKDKEMANYKEIFNNFEKNLQDKELLISLNEKSLSQKDLVISNLNKETLFLKELLHQSEEKLLQKEDILQQELYISQENLEKSKEMLEKSLNAKNNEIQHFVSKITILENSLKEKNEEIIKKNQDFSSKMHEFQSQQEYMKILEKSNEDLLRKSSTLTMEIGLSTEKFEALQKAHETLQARFDSQEQSFLKKQAKLQKDLEIKANNSQELLKRLDNLKEDNEKIKKKQEKIIEEIEIKHSEEIKGLYDDRKVQLERLMSQKEEVTVEYSRKYEEFQTEIEKYKKLISNLKKQNENLEKELENKEDFQKKSSNRLFKETEKLKEDLKNIIKEKDKFQKDVIDKEENFQRTSQKIKLLQNEKEACEARFQKELNEKDILLKGLQEKAQEYCKTQEKDFEQIKKEYAKVREENIKLKEDLTVEAEKIKRIINKSSDSSEVLQLKSEIEKKNQIVKSYAEGINKLNNIISINGFQKFHNTSNNNSSRGNTIDLESIVQGVQYLIAGSLEKENKIKEKERDLDSKNLKYTIMEREYLLQKQKLHILQHSERRKDRSSGESLEKNHIKSTETIEKIAFRERGNSLHKIPSNAGMIYKKH